MQVLIAACADHPSDRLSAPARLHVPLDLSHRFWYGPPP